MAKILIVDDDVKVTTLLKRYLSSAGHEVTAINDSSKAIQSADKVRPNLFIFDMMMPQPDGYRLCGLIRANPVYQHTPILIITALDYSNSKAASFGADDYLTKPFDLDELGPKIQFLLNKTRIV